MVVGIKQTRREISTGSVVSTPTDCPAAFSLNCTNGGSVATTSKKMIVKAERRIVNAISFGVFWRFDPSTKEIILSRKVSPCSETIRTTIRSLSTLVPPVTALRSSPLSRITGADSPVMVDSSTLAIPSMMTPSEGMTSPASQTTISPLCSSVAGIEISSSPSSFRATI